MESPADYVTGLRLGVASAAVLLVIILLGASLAGATSTPAAGTSVAGIPTAPSAPPSAAPAQGSGAAAPTNTTAFGTNSELAATVASDERSLAAAGLNPAAIHPPNLHQAPPLSSTGGEVTPLYSIAPAPMGVGYFGLRNTTGRTVSTTVDTTSLVGTYSTSDALGTQTEEFDVPTGPGYNDIQPSFDSYGAQLNSVITNVTVFGQTSFYNTSDPDAPSGCPGYGGNPTSGPAPCPNEFWLQNYIEYVPATGMMQIGDEIWNFSNPTASWGVYNGSTVDQNTLVGFGSISDGLYYLTNVPSEYGPTIHMPYPFTLALYLNVTRGPCHTDSTPGTGVPSCRVDGSKVSTTEPVNEIFFNYSVWKTPSQPCPSGDVCQGQHVCPAVEPYPGVVCGEYDDIFWNSVSRKAPTVGVPEYGPHGRIGSAAIEANGSAYDPVGLTNDFEFDYGIGSDDGDTNGVAYADGTVGVDYCPRAETLPNGACSQYSATPSAMNFGGETGETSTGEVDYWAPQSTSAGAGFLTVPGSPVAHQVTGPSLLEGLWNMSGTPYPGGTGAFPLSYAHIAPANAWVGIAAGAGVRSQAAFQVAPTFGWYSYWKGSGGSTVPTELGSNLFLPVGEYTIEVLLSGYAPYVRTVDLTATGQAPTIRLTPDPSTGVYTPLWAFSSSDLANVSTNGGSPGVGTSSQPYLLESGPPTVGAPFGQAGSLSWLFSNLNDYLFPVWYGEFLNSTRAYAVADPAPSFEMIYPAWQRPNLAFFDAPSSRDFQLYYFHVKDFTLAGTTGITTWATFYTVPVAAVTFEGGQHDLVANNSFAVADQGLALVGGASVPPAHGFPDGVRNIVWGNTFTPDPQSNRFAGLFSPSTALTVLESYDRVYNNAFDALSGGRAASALSPASYSNWWNASCQAGYQPLASGSYPGPVPCEPLAYSQDANGFDLTGSIVATDYQGGNYWATYGGSDNPYGVLPFRDVGTSGNPRIGSDQPSFGGDYAPLILHAVYRLTFVEYGLPATHSPTAFQVEVSSLFPGSPNWTNATATIGATSPCGYLGVCVTFYVPAGFYQFVVSEFQHRGTRYLPEPSHGVVIVGWSPAHLVRVLFVTGHAVAPHGAYVPVASRRP
jgi:thermopsin